MKRAQHYIAAAVGAFAGKLAGEMTKIKEHADRMLKAAAPAGGGHVAAR